MKQRQSAFDVGQRRAKYFLTPPDLMAKVKVELGESFFDPCPYPRPDGYNSLVLDWHERNYHQSTVSPGRWGQWRRTYRLRTEGNRGESQGQQVRAGTARPELRQSAARSWRDDEKCWPGEMDRRGNRRSVRISISNRNVHLGRGRREGAMTDEVTLFCTNGDGTVDCAWCGETFNADLARPDSNDEPMCPACVESAEEESLEMTREDYLADLSSTEPELSLDQLEAEYQKFDKWRKGKLAARGAQ